MSAKAASLPKSGQPAMKFVPIILILLVIAGAAYYFVAGGGSSTSPIVAKPGATAPTAAVPGTTAAPTAATPAAAPAPEATKEQLLKEASVAYRENNLVAPAGSNALELYMRVLDKDPNNASARDALLENFQYFTSPTEGLINAGKLDEANRVIDLLTKVDPSNFTLNILRSKLDAKKKQVDHDQTVAAAAAARAAAAPAQSAQSTQNSTPPTAAPVEAAPTPAPATTVASRATTPTPSPAVAAPAPVAATPAGGDSHPAELVRAVQPDYPPDAYRSRAQGWVEVEFTVGADGSVNNATVVGSEPSRIFNNAALNAIRRWTFKPKLDNGKAVDDRMRRRIEFKLS
jgi:periplasmic protein TonB